MRARLPGQMLGAGLAALLLAGPAAAAGTTTTTSPVTTAAAGALTGEGSTTSTSTTSTTSTSSTTTTTLPSAVTTVPEGCALPPVAQAVFVGTVQKVDPVSATFAVSQVRAGSLDGYAAGDSVEVRYGTDVKFLEPGTSYIVGVALDAATQKLSSTVRDRAELFGGNEVAGGGAECPRFEAVARTLHTDGSSIESGVFSNFLGDPARLATAVLLPSVLVFLLLLALVWARRGARR